jgi:hypothetical protein
VPPGGTVITWVGGVVADATLSAIVARLVVDRAERDLVLPRAERDRDRERDRERFRFAK